MRPVRRLAAVATYVLSIHLAIAGGTSACAEGGNAKQEFEHGAMQMHHGGVPSSQPTHHHPQGGSHCSMPCAPVGCAASGSCGVNAVGASSLLRDSIGGPHSATVRALVSAPRSVSAGPEPPPPRA